MIEKSSVYVSALVLGCMVLVSGCGRGLPAGKVRVTGQITLDGTPLTHTGEGIFLINLASNENTETAAAQFDPASGEFSLVIAPGDYVACVKATDGFDEDDSRRGRIIYAKSLVPKKYGSLRTSDAAVSVPPNGGQILVELYGE